MQRDNDSPTFFKLNNLRMEVARLGPRRRGLASSVMPGSSAAPFLTTTAGVGEGVGVMMLGV